MLNLTSFEKLTAEVKELVLPEGSANEIDSKGWLIHKIENSIDVIEDLSADEVKELYNEFRGAYRALQSKERHYKKELQKKEEITAAMNKGIVDAMTLKKHIEVCQDMLLNNMLLGRKDTTLDMYSVPKASFKPTDGRYVQNLGFFRLPESRLTRFFEANHVIEKKVRQFSLKNGEKVEASVEYSYSELVDNPILFMEFVGEPKFEDEAQYETHELCKKIIKNGLHIKYKGEDMFYEYTQSSASEMRTLKGVFVSKDYAFTEEYLSKFKPVNDTPEELAAFDKFIEKLRGLRGAEVIYTAMSYGAYLTEYKGVKTSPAKFMARLGMAQTSTKSLGNDFRVKLIGEIKFPWTDELEEEFRSHYTSLVDRNSKRLHSDEKVEKIIKLIRDIWKEEKDDGQNMIKASAIIRGFRRLGIRLTPDQVIGKLIQFRWAGVKGTALVVPDALFENATMVDGTHPYSGYDIIAESSSWKYTPDTRYFRGELAPELELVAISKSKHSNNLNYQFIAALDGGDGNNTGENLRSIVDGRFAFATQVMSDPEVAKADFGIKSMKESDLDDLDIDDYEKSLTTIMSKALDACDDIIYDRSWRAKYTNRFTRSRDKMSYGKIPVDGANRFVISDPTAFFRVDLAVPRMKGDQVQKDFDGNDMFDIVITHMNQVALSGINDCYWGNTDQEAVLFRSPCVHPGEPQRVSLIGLDKIPEYVSTPYDRINVKELFESIKHLVVINCFSSILDALGGANL